MTSQDRPGLLIFLLFIPPPAPRVHQLSLLRRGEADGLKDWRTLISAPLQMHETLIATTKMYGPEVMFRCMTR